MDSDDSLPRRANDPLGALLAQDLSPLSIAELDVRIAALEGEIARTRARIDAATDQRASADALFRR